MGKLWLEGQDEVGVEFKNTNDIHDDAVFCEYDFVWFGFSRLYFEFNYDPMKSIVSVHDPFEIFPQEPQWKKLKPFPEIIDAMKRVCFIVTASVEMDEILHANGVRSCLIPTCSILPPRDPGAVSAGKCDFVSVCGVFPRKDLVLMEKLLDYSTENLSSRFNVRIGSNSPLSNEDYIRFMDAHEAFVCTSYQEGGPIAPMDAMTRGCAVLSTPVGQMTEIIENGVNGFLCRDEDDFIDRMKHLSENRDLLHGMRLASLKNIQEKRNIEYIKKMAAEFLRGLKKNSNTVQRN